VAWSRADADLACPDSWLSRLEALRPSVVINAASDNAVDRAESDPEAAFRINAFAVRRLAQQCARLGALLVHYSSNLVFGHAPEPRTPWIESDRPAPLSAYGTSKLAGECFVQALCPRHLLIRTAAVLGSRVGATGPWNFVEKVLDASQRGTRLRIAADQYVAPISTRDLAEATLRLIGAEATGLFHVNGADACTWHEYAYAVLTRAGNAEAAATLEAVTTRELGLPAPRPLYSVLSNQKYVRLGFSEPAGWRASLDAYWRERRGVDAARET
jgi:dTDP-4-dehydrorhamnose reductase